MENPKIACKMSIHENFRDAVKSRAATAYQQGRGVAHISPHQRSRRTPIDSQLRSQFGQECQQWSHIRGTQAPSSSSSSTTWWNPQQWEERHQWQERQDWHGWQEWDERAQFFFLQCQNHFANVFASQSIFLLDISCSDIGECRARGGRWGDDRTPHRTQHTRRFVSLRAVQHSVSYVFFIPCARIGSRL